MDGLGPAIFVSLMLAAIFIWTLDLTMNWKDDTMSCELVGRPIHADHCPQLEE